MQPADDEADDEDLETNSVFGLVTIIPLELNKQESPAFANVVQEYIMAKIGRIDNKARDFKIKYPKCCKILFLRIFCS